MSQKEKGSFQNKILEIISIFLPSKRKGSLQNRIMKTISLLILIPMVLLALISIIQLITLGDNIGDQGSVSLELERTQILLEKSQDVGDYVTNFFNNVEDDLNRMVSYEEQLFNGSIEVLDNRPSFRQGDVSTPPDLNYSSNYGGNISYDYSDYVNISIMDVTQNQVLVRSAYMDYITSNVLQNNPYYGRIIMVFTNGLSRMFPYYQSGRSINEDLRDNTWYTSTMETPGNILYSDPIAGYLGPSIYITKAVYNSSTLIGVIGLEVKLSQLRIAISEMPTYQDGYVTLINDNGISLVHPNLNESDAGDFLVDLEGGSSELSAIIPQIISGNSQIKYYSKSGDQWVIAYISVPVGDLHCATLVPQSNILAPGDNLLLQMNQLMTPRIVWSIVFLFILILGLWIVTVLLSRRITLPITDLTSSVDRMSRGDLSREIVMTNRNKRNEIGLMAQSLQNLLVTMRFGNKSYYQGDLNLAFQNYSTALELFQTVGNKKGVGTCLNNIGNIYRNWGSNSKAQIAYDQSIHIGQELNDEAGLAARYNNRGLLFLALEKWDDASRDFHQALTIDESMGDEIRVAVRKRNLGVLYLLQKDFKKAEMHFKEALKIDTDFDNSYGLSEDQFQLGRLFIALNKFDLAEDSLKNALKIAEKLENFPLMHDIFGRMVELYETTGNKSFLHKAQGELAKIKDLLIRKKNVVFVIDLSGSMREHGKMKAAKQGALEVFDVAINNKDKVAIIGFHSEIDRILNLVEKGPNINHIRSNFNSIEATPYQTKFYDAVAEGLDILGKSSKEEQLWLVALTDGLDNLSYKFTPVTLAKYIKSMGTSVNVVIIGVGPALRQIADQLMLIVNASSKGKYIPVYSVNQVAEQIKHAFKKVQKIMASSEIEGFSPEEA